MLTPDVRFEGWTTEDWRRFLGLFTPRAALPADEATRPRGGILAIHDGARLRKLLHTARGRIELPPSGGPLPTLSELAESHRASWGLMARFGALDELMERFGARARRGDDLTAQALSLVSIARELIDEGEIDSWPRRLAGLPVPTAAMVDRAIDALCADGRALCLGLFQGGDLYTAFVARRRGHGFDVIAGPEELRASMGLLSGDWRRDYRHLVRAVEERYAPLSLGCFGEVETLLALQLDAPPGAWGRAVAVRDVVLSPIPAGVGLALGLDGARLALGAARSLTAHVDALGFLDPMMAALRRRVGSVVGDRDVAGVLGFDPLAALRALLRR